VRQTPDARPSRRTREGRDAEKHASDVAALVLRGLGIVPEEAEAIARRPLPPLPPVA
jgi:hypothetical protein